MNEISFLNPVEVSNVADVYKTATGVDSETVQNQALLNVVRLAPSHVDNLEWAIQHMAAHKPQDAIESMLAQQMIALNTLIMKSSKLALSDSQTNAGYDMHLKHVARLSKSFANVVAVLAKHRGKGEQTIVVKHQQVNVEPGGQAVIGDVFLA